MTYETSGKRVQIGFILRLLSEINEGLYYYYRSRLSIIPSFQRTHTAKFPVDFQSLIIVIGTDGRYNYVPVVSRGGGEECARVGAGRERAVKL